VCEKRDTALPIANDSRYRGLRRVAFQQVASDIARTGSFDVMNRRRIRVSVIELIDRMINDLRFAY